MTALNPTMRVADQIADGIALHRGISKHEARHKAVDMLEMVEIPRFRARDYPHQFSGGMKQRVVIAIAWPATLICCWPMNLQLPWTLPFRRRCWH